MAFDIATTVTEASARSADAISQDEELDDFNPSGASENADEGDENAEEVEATTEDGDDEAEDDAGAEARSPYVNRKNFDKVNTERNELRARLAELEAAQAAPAAPAPDEWEPVRQEFQRLGFTPQAAAAQVAEQKRQADQAAYERENDQIHNMIMATGEVDPEINPGAYAAMFRAERHAFDLNKQAVLQAKAFAYQQFPDADLAVLDAFGVNPQQIEAIARHTHTRTAELKASLTKAHAAEIETAKKQAVLEYIESQKTNRAAGVERGTTGAVQRTATAKAPHKVGTGMRIPVQTRGRF